MYFTPFFRRTVNCEDRVARGLKYGDELFRLLGLDYSFVSENNLFVAALFAIFLFLLIILTVR